MAATAGQPPTHGMTTCPPCPVSSTPARRMKATTLLGESQAGRDTPGDAHTSMGEPPPSQAADQERLLPADPQTHPPAGTLAPPWRAPASPRFLLTATRKRSSAACGPPTRRPRLGGRWTRSSQPTGTLRNDPRQDTRLIKDSCAGSTCSSYNSTVERQMTQLKSGRTVRMDLFPKDTGKWPHHHLCLQGSASGAHGETRLRPARTAVTQATRCWEGRGEVGRRARRALRKQSGGSSRVSHVARQFHSWVRAQEK